jgi:ATP-binding cassette subfamily B protein
MQLRHRDHAGVASLDLVDPQGKLAGWRFTLAQDPAARNLADRFHAQLECVLAGRAPTPPEPSPAPPATRRCRRAPTSAPPAPARSTPRRPPGRCCACGASPSPTRASCWPASSSRCCPPAPPGAALPHHAADGRGADPLPERRAHRPAQGHDAAGRLLGAALAWSLGWAKTYILALASERIGADLRITTYEHLQGLSLEYFGGKRTGDLMSRIGAETDRITLFLSLHLLDFATDVLMITMTAAILISINPWLALVTLVPLPFIAWLIHAVRDRLRYGFEQVDRVWSEVTSVLADTIPGIRVVKAFAQEKREVNRFRDANLRNLQVNDRVNRIWSVFSPTVTLATEVGLLIVWGFGIWLVADKSITVGVLTAFLTYISRFYTRLDSMSRIVSFTQKAAAGAKRIFDILDHVSSVPEPVKPQHLPAVTGAIECARSASATATAPS